MPANTPICAEQRIVEVACRLPRTSAITGWASLRLADAGFFDGKDSDGKTDLAVPVALQPYQRLERDSAIRQIRGGICAHETHVRHGIPCTIAERAILDAIKDSRSDRDAVRIIDMALAARTTTVPRLGQYGLGHSHRSGICRFRDALPLATDRSRSPMETAMRLIWVLDAKLPDPLSNWPVLDGQGRFIGTPDLLSPDLGVFGEFDGADHRDKERHRVDVERAERFKDVGLEGFTLVGSDLRDRQLVIARMHAAVRRAAARPRGTWQIPDEASVL